MNFVVIGTDQRMQYSEPGFEALLLRGPRLSMQCSFAVTQLTAIIACFNPFSRSARQDSSLLGHFSYRVFVRAESQADPITDRMRLAFLA